MEDANLPPITPHLTDAPLVTIRNDCLWTSEDDTIREEIEQIARRVIAPLVDLPIPAKADDYTGMDSIVYGIHGGWGTGKSTFLRLVQERTLGLERKAGMNGQVVYVNYDASAYEAIQTRPGITLAMRIMEGLGQDQAARVFRDAIGHDLRSVGPGEWDQAETLVPDLQSVATALADLADFPRRVTEEIVGRGELAGGAPRVVLVLIDELDRCKPEFVYEILRAVRHWRLAPNLVFVLAVAEEPLKRSIETRGGTEGAFDDPSYALEKYIQHAVVLPDLEEARLVRLLETLLPGERDPVFAVIHAGRDFLTSALRGAGYDNPRAVKRCINTIRPHVAQQVRKSLPSSETGEDEGKNPETEVLFGAFTLPREKLLLAVKEQVLWYRWQDFYRSLFVPGVKQNRRPYAEIFSTLERNCWQYILRERDIDWELLTFLLDRLAAVLPEEKLEFPRDLLHYLSLPPYWTLEAGSASQARQREEDGPQQTRGPWPENATQDGGGGKGDGLIDDVLSTGAAAENLSLLSRKREQQVRDIRQRAYQFYIQSEAAEQRGDIQGALENAEALLQLVRQYESAFDGDFCPTIGNAALTAERFHARDLAYQLYELAYRLDPEHSNNMQNYVEFIVDEELEQFYPRAGELVQKLQTGRHASHRFDRTLTLSGRLAVLQEQSVPLSRQQLADVVRYVVDHPEESGRFIDVSRLLDEMGEYDLLTTMTEHVLEHDLPAEQQYIVLRAYADHLATSGQNRLRRKALDLYRSMLSDEPLTLEDHRAERAIVLHNYATLLYAYDYNEEAGRRWHEAYCLDPADDKLKYSYARYLMPANRSMEAETVMRGEPLDASVEELLQRDGNALPEGSFLVEDEAPAPDTDFTT